MSLKIVGAGHKSKANPKAKIKCARDGKKFFDLALKYLKRSNMASFVISELERTDKMLIIHVNSEGGDTNEYIYPELCKAKGGCLLKADAGPICGKGGCVQWSALKNLKVKDRKDKRKGLSKETVRPKVPWAKPKKSELGLSVVEGILPAPLLLIHEMGHAMQYLTDKKEFLARAKVGMWNFKKPNFAELEQLNVQAIENTVIMELRQAGVDIGVRWDYFAAGDPVFDDNWTKKLK